MNTNFKQSYKPSGEIRFDQFNPVRSPNNRNNNRGKKPIHSSDHKNKLHAEYKRIQRRMREIESILKINNPESKNGKPVRYGNDFRGYSYKKNDRNFKKAPIINKDIVKDVEQNIIDTKKELGF